MNKLMRRTAIAAAGLAAVGGTVGPSAVDAAGSWHPISGATSWLSPCNWYTSSNVRYVSSGGSAIKVNLSSTGPLGVKFRVKFENTGLTSSIAYIPPLNTVQQLAGTKSGGTPFRNQFSCINPRGSGSPSTDFDGSELY